MARIYSSGAESQSTTTGVEGGDSANIGMAISTTTVRSGAASWRANASTSQPSFDTRITASATMFGRTYFNMASLPNKSTAIFILYKTSSSASVGVSVDTTGHLILWTSTNGTTGTTIGTSAGTYSLSTWYRLEIKADVSANPWVVELKVDGVSVISSTFAATATTLDTVSIEAAGFTVSTYTFSNCTMDVFFDDIAVNNNSGASQTSYPGAGQIVHLLPNNSGDNNDFTTQTGGTAGAGNNFTRVDEVTPNDVTDFNGDNVTGHSDDFNIDPTPSSIATGDTINVVAVGVRYRASVASAVSSFQLRLKKVGAGTVNSSAATTPNSTTWKTNTNAVPNTPLTTLYNDPDGSPWTKANLDTTQIGYNIQTGSTNRADISTIWLLVDSTPNATATKTQTGVARISIVTPQTQPGLSRITASTSKTQTGLARLTNTTLRTITGLARVSIVTLKTITGKSRITVSTAQTQTGKSRITATTSKTINGLSRITITTLKTITGLSRITITTLKTQTGKARITATSLQTQQGKARITITTPKTITGVARITASATKTQSGVARITAKTLKTIAGLARITVTSLQTITGKSRITIVTPKTQTGLSRITVTTPKTQTGKARLTSTASKTQTGLSNLTQTLSTDYFTIITITVADQTITGLARITATATKTQPGVSRITVKSVQTINAKARITITSSQTITGKSRLTVKTLRTIGGVARITVTTPRTQTGKARLTVSATHTIGGVARIMRIVPNTQTGKASIMRIGSSTITGKSRLVAAPQTITDPIPLGNNDYSPILSAGDYSSVPEDENTTIIVDPTEPEEVVLGVVNDEIVLG